MLTRPVLRELYGADFEDLILTEDGSDGRPSRAAKPRKKSLEAYAALAANHRQRRTRP